ncbi:MAG: HNH endonuclease [Rhodoferax sp.]
MFETRGYPREKAAGLYFWLWRLSPTFPVYARVSGEVVSSVFIDAEHAELNQVLSTVKGIEPSKNGARKNNKFELFRFQKTHPHTGRVEYEGWKYEFTSEAGCQAFMEVCEAYDRAGLAAAEEVASKFERRASRKTNRTVVTDARVGQPEFKRELLRFWRSCAVTGVGVQQVLRASHMKPWSASSSKERLDPFNGLLLTANFDALFDAGLISFDREGRILISSQISPSEYAPLGLDAALRVRKLNTAHQPYLEYHREHVFKP